MRLLSRYYEAGCGSVWLGDGARWQPLRLPVGLPGYHVNPLERSRSAEAAARPKEIHAATRPSGLSTAAGSALTGRALTSISLTGSGARPAAPTARRLGPRR